MHLAGFFVEYLIIGSMGLVWLLPLLRAAGVEPPESAALVLLAPMLYVVGMFVDTIAHAIMNPIRDRIKKSARHRYCERFEIDPARLKVAGQEIMHSSSELSQGYNARTSRARVARGAFMNTVLFSALSFWIVPKWTIGLFAGLAVAAVFFYAWHRWQKLAYMFEAKSICAIDQQRTAMAA